MVKLLPDWISDESNYIRSSILDRSKPKIGCSSLITKRWTRSSSFNVRKNESVRWFDGRCPLVQSQNSGVRVRSSIYEHVWVRSMFEKWGSSFFDVRLNGVWPITRLDIVLLTKSYLKNPSLEVGKNILLVKNNLFQALTCTFRKK